MSERAPPRKSINCCSLPNPPISDIVISLAIVNGGADIESISLRRVEHGALWFSILVQVVISISKENRQCSLNSERLSKIDDHAGPPGVVAVGHLIELRVGDIDAPQPLAGALVGFRPGCCARRRRHVRVLSSTTPSRLRSVCRNTPSAISMGVFSPSRAARAVKQTSNPLPTAATNAPPTTTASPAAPRAPTSAPAPPSEPVSVGAYRPQERPREHRGMLAPGDRGRRMEDMTSGVLPDGR